MDQIQYIGESLWPGRLAHFFVILSFVSILYAAFSYYKATLETSNGSQETWKRLGRIGFILHSLSVISIIAILLYLMASLRYEYYYVYEHCSDDLPMRFLFSAFWEGQEGSFLLWMFWHSILGLILLKTAKEWESSVFIFLALVEAVLASMILGIHFEFGDFSYKMGSNPTVLLRDVFNAPIFQDPNYLDSIKGDGLNPLLQNYWMTIHPPILFLGFASCTIPFAYASAGFLTRQFDEWIKPVLPWALISTAFLGTGILMGGAWAYEALTFGGYWAWDPVENMSLVPWLIFVAGIHSNLIARSTGRSIKASYIYYSLAFILVLYSTYLTRSGVLGDSSVHSFTDMGLEIQLIFLVLFFAVLSAYLYTTRTKEIPKQITEESIYSREFWMYIGSIILLFSGLIIAISTSLPVFNEIVRIFDPSYTGSVINDPIHHYNRFQLWIAVLIATLTAGSIFLRYKTGSWDTAQKTAFLLRNLAYILLAIATSYAINLWINYWHWSYTLLAISALFTIISSVSFFIIRLRGNIKMAASVISHSGVGIMILGIIASGLNEKIISTNPFADASLINDQDQGKVISLIKGESTFSEGYWIRYLNDTIVDNTRIFTINFEQRDSEGRLIESFTVKPNVLFSNDLTKVAASNPDAKHFLSKDIFVSVQSLPPSQMDAALAKEAEDSMRYLRLEASLGDSIFTDNAIGVLEYLSFDQDSNDLDASPVDAGLTIGIRLYSKNTELSELIEPRISLSKDLLYQYPAQSNELGIKLKINEESFDRLFSQEEELTYEEFKIRQNEEFRFKDIKYTLKGFERNTDQLNYDYREGDVAVMAILEYSDKDSTGRLNPIYLIRDNKPSSIKDYDMRSGVHARLSDIDPVNELFTISLAMDNRTDERLVLDMAEGVGRTDFIGIEAIVFPGINLFWAGSILMLLGFFISFFFRSSIKYA